MADAFGIPNTIPVGPLGIIATPGCEELAQKINNYLTSWREERESEHKETIAFYGYQRDTFIVDADFTRFGSGEGKCLLHETVRGYDIYIICDCFNHGVTYNMYGYECHYSPDEHYANLKRAISAVEGKARRINVIMPMLYEGRQHRRTTRESLDCAMALQELVAMGVKNIITFDAHDPRVQNAIPLDGFDNVQATYQMIKALLKNYSDIELDPKKTMIVSPDEGGMGRCIYYSSVLGLPLGMFYKRRNYSIIVNGKNPIEAHEFLGDDVKGKDLILVDDMISSGESMLDIAARLKEKGAKRIFIFSTFGLFVEGFEKYDEYYKNGYIDKIFTTNLIYNSPELLEKEWYCNVNMAKYIALLIDTLNCDNSISNLLNPIDRIKNIVAKYKEGK